MLWDHSAYCRKCRKRVYVQQRYHSSADDKLWTLITLGGWTLLKWVFPARFGRWQCDECGSLSCVSIRRAKERGERRRHSRRRSRRR
ncbi:MAG: hypothetical protein ACOX9C_01545 [Kiritimatiellia bacterium]|jgi:hypothetical protein